MAYAGGRLVAYIGDRNESFRDHVIIYTASVQRERWIRWRGELGSTFATCDCAACSQRRELMQARAN